MYEATVTTPSPPSSGHVDELRAVRGRLVAAADGERRRIERALHDGVQQDLIAVSVGLQLARQLVGTDLPAVIAVLDEVGRDVRDALDRVRALGNEIYPSLLEARGLSDALRGAVAGAQVVATIESTGVGRYGAEVEEAVYFCCRAALEAVAAQGGADSMVTIRVREEERALRLEVDADIVDHDAVTDRLGSTRDRIDALGGVISVDSTPGRGIRLAATVPLA